MLFKKNLHATSPRLSCMLVQILDYNIEFHHQEGSKMHLSDVLSCVSTHDRIDEKANAKPIADFNVTIHDVEILTGFNSLSLELMKHETEVDKDMQLLKQHIIDGFPNAKSCLPEPIRPFYGCRESLTVINGVIMKAKCIVIPASLHEKTIETLHKVIWESPRPSIEPEPCYSGQTCRKILKSI